MFIDEEKINLKTITLKELVYDMRKDLSFLIDRMDREDLSRKEINKEIRNIEKRLIEVELKVGQNTRFTTIFYSILSTILTALTIHFLTKNN